MSTINGPLVSLILKVAHIITQSRTSYPKHSRLKDNRGSSKLCSSSSSNDTSNKSNIHRISNLMVIVKAMMRHYKFNVFRCVGFRAGIRVWGLGLRARLHLLTSTWDAPHKPYTWRVRET